MKGKVIWLFFPVFLGLWAWKSEIPICTVEGDQYNVRAMSLSDGRIAISWRDRRNDTSKTYLQVLNSLGEPLFVKDGIRVSQRGGLEVEHSMTTDGSDIFVVWEGAPGKTRENTDIFLTKINGSTGEKKWGDIAVCTAEGDQYTPQLCISGEGEYFGAWVCWTDYRNYETTGPDVWLARISPEGEKRFEVGVCSLDNNQTLKGMVPSGKGCIVFLGKFLWRSTRNIWTTVY